MKDHDFLEIDEESLPDVELTEEQKERARKRLNKYVDKFKESNKDLDINCSLSEISKIEKELGSKVNTIRHGVHGAYVLKELILNTIDKEITNTHKDIVYSCFLLGGFKEAIVGYVPVYSNTPYYYQIYVTNTELIIYSFDWFFKLINKRNIKLNDIKKVGVAPQFFVSKELDRESLLISLDISSDPYLHHYTFLNENDCKNNDIKDLCNILVSLGISEYTKSYFTKANKRYRLSFIIYNIIFVIFGIWVLSNVL